MRVLLLPLALAIAAVWVSCAPALSARAPAPTPDGVRFEFVRTGARSVAIAGSFNVWSASANPMTEQNGKWVAVVRLPPGEHLFMYVVNGNEWVTPPMADDYADDGFGTRNGIVVVR